MVRLARAVSILVAVSVAVGCSDEAPEPQIQDVPPVCYECFWEHQDPELRAMLVDYFRGFETPDPLIRAEVAYLLARMESDPVRLCGAFDAFGELAVSESDPMRRLLVEETLAFTAAECGRSPEAHFRLASDFAAVLGDAAKSQAYRELATGKFVPSFGGEDIVTEVEIPDGSQAYVLGESAIRVTAETTVGVQVERTVRDWLSNQFRRDTFESPRGLDEVLDWHEGARLRDMMRFAGVVVRPLTGTLVARSGERWLAPDGEGVFRFEVLPDKIQYPTTRAWGDVALLVDTHGVSSLVAPAMHAGVDVVLGCGDHPEKMKAAYHLARSGIDVYFPCDRFVGDLVGYRAPAVLVGSAPVRPAEGGAVIGDRPVTFRIDEILVVQDTEVRGVLQYYDAPARYFTGLAGYVPLRLDTVSIDGPGQCGRVIDRAVQVGSSAVAVRVWNEDDYRAVGGWLAASRVNRAVLFHSAPYTPGYRLFEEFPGQTTFGDPRPRFVAAGSGDG